MDLYDYYLSVSETAELLSLSVPGVHKLCKELKLNTKNGRKHKITPDIFLSLREYLGFTPFAPKRVSLHNIKGGVGKTSISNAVAIRCASLGMKTLVVDLDKQANLTESFGIDPDKVDVNSFYCLAESYIQKKKKRGKWFATEFEGSIIQLNDFLDIVPADLDLANLDLLIWNSAMDLSALMKNIFSPIEDEYDLILFDLPPDFNRLTFCANSYANTVIMPVTLGRFAIRGIKMTMEHLNEMESDSSGKSRERIIILNKFDARHTIRLSSSLSQDYGDSLFPAIIPISHTVETAIGEGTCVWRLSRKKCPALDGFEALANHVADVQHWKRQKKGNQRIKEKRSFETEVSQ